jgi:hypothetical protein
MLFDEEGKAKSRTAENALAVSGVKSWPELKKLRESGIWSRSLETRECGANAKGGGGFQPGNSCGKGDGSGASDPSKQAKAGNGPRVKAARDEHAKHLDKLRKNIVADAKKAEAKYLAKWEEHALVSSKLARHMGLVEKVSAEHEAILEQFKADPLNESLSQKMKESSDELMAERLAIEPLERAEAKARKERDKALSEKRNSTAKTLAKEAAAVDKEDGITAAMRKRSVRAVEETHKSESQITEWAERNKLPDSVTLSRTESAVAARTEAQAFLRAAVNPTIHTNALEGPIEYADGVRANAAGWAQEYESLTGMPPMRMEVVLRTQLSPTSNASTVLHEFGHQIEHGNIEAAKLCHDFLESRVGGEQPVSFSERFKGYGYRDDEKGSPDDFGKAVGAAYGLSDGDYKDSIAHYAGKQYDGNGKKSGSGWATYGATEVLSIGMEMLAKDAIKFSKADPEWFDLVTGISTGRLLTETRKKRR